MDIISFPPVSGKLKMINREEAIGMMWLFLVLGIICLLVVVKKRSSEELSIEESDESEYVPLAPLLVDGSEEEYLIAVITAAIQEFTGSGDFEVVQIKQHAQNWTLIGRQNLLR